MGKTTGISWTMRTWNPWRGCTRISPGCDHCYMFTAQLRYGREPSWVIRTKTWGDPLKWQREAEAAGRRDLVFTCSWSDWFHKDADPWREEAWELVKRCPNLIFQILTKRSGRMASHLPVDWGSGYPNVWLGVSVESNAYAWRADHLRKVPAAVRFISAEPLLEDITQKLNLTGIDWVIVGGESGPGFRPMDPEWALSMFLACRRAGTKFFFKQTSGPRPGMPFQYEVAGIVSDLDEVKEFPATAMELSARGP